MNWKEIKKQYPKAYSEYTEWLISKGFKPVLELNILVHRFTDGVHSLVQSVSLPDRKLYDFFDSNEIYILISNDSRTEWTWDIENDKSILESWEHEEDSRSKSERVAFFKAFQILEAKS